MLKHTQMTHRSSFLADMLLAMGLGSAIYGMALFAGEWNASFNPSYAIDLSLKSLPLYALFSALRSLAAYAISLAFTIVVGYWAANSKSAERVIIPILDILQSIPVLGFLPGLVLGLVAIFPRSNAGLELAAILMIFTGQVWNMTFAFYSSLKSVPGDLKEAASVMGLSARTKLLRLELPFSAVNLVWNSIMSMAGGWFFLTVCEAFTLGDKEYRLPGIGAYMAVAIEKGDTKAMFLGVFAMAFIIITLDTLIWRPALAWVHRFRLEETLAVAGEDKLLNFVISQSSMVRSLRGLMVKRRRRQILIAPRPRNHKPIKLPQFNWTKFLHYGRLPIAGLILLALTAGFIHLIVTMLTLSLSNWLQICIDTSLTFLRVLSCLILGSLWAVPMGIWLTRKPQRLRFAQPIAQLLASFPAPMLYPLVVAIVLSLGIKFSIGSMLLMLLGVQWYILFNTLAGGLRIPAELVHSMDLVGSSRLDRWRYLYLPSVFPSLVTGWVTAAGGAWNASIVAEYLSYKGQTIQTRGLGALISQSAAKGDFPMLSACLVIMVIVVVLLNRFFWDRIYKIAQTRFRLDF
jgi:NitT/TauT family transport system permease protein